MEGRFPDSRKETSIIFTFIDEAVNDVVPSEDFDSDDDTSQSLGYLFVFAPLWVCEE